MNAIQFIQQHGVEKAREVVDGAPKGAEVYAYRSKTYFSSPSCIYDKKLSSWEEMDRGMDLDLYEEQIWLDDLKRLVESVDLVEHFGNDIVGAKQLLEFSKDCKTIELSGSVITIERLEQAIADCEAIYSDDIKIEVSFGISLMSPERLACVDLTPKPAFDLEDLRDCDTSPNCKKFDEQVK